ncbi:MAG: NACHT domain-containing protein [Flavobacteriales bacterium]|nr:NACHT domain-containing protein [Flavobacteriales bacterium]
MSSLSAAHRGYLVQDVLTAYILAESLVNGYEAVTVDRKKVAGDKLDDLEITTTGHTSRRQLKTSADLTTPLEEDDFNHQSSPLRIDLLVKSYVRAGDEAATEYILCTTWTAPAASSSLYPLVETVVHKETVAGSRTRFLRLRHEAIWPSGSSPTWKWLSDIEITREVFATFCERFFIELELPSVAGDLLNPGPLDKALLNILRDRVGIGQYPNRDRVLEDVADRLCVLASRARVSGLTLTPAQVEQQLNLQTDYGFVAQSFPLDENHFCDRESLRPVLKKSAINGVHQLVIGPPGCGKSWELTKVAEELKNVDTLVAKHYCYLAPGDQDVERRVLSDTLFGNIIHELVTQRPELRDAAKRRYAAGPLELQELLDCAVQLGLKVVLIVDGLDHIVRVISASPSLSVAETDIISQLSSLHLPSGVSLIIGSQPGPHLDELRRGLPGCIEHLVEPWSNNEVLQLVDRIGLQQGIRESGLALSDALVELFVTRTEGSPLYATYLAKEALEQIRRGSAIDFEHWLEAIVPLDGNIAAYYEHLYQEGNDLAQHVANVLGAIDFSVTEIDLSEIVGPVMSAELPVVLKRLSPILHNVSSQGGIRIFHESFRRFITERHTSTAALSRICDWLLEKGFFEDARAYRFLLPALRRASRSAEILERMDVAFVSSSVEHGHTERSIERNLAIALQVAADEQTWTSIVQCAELSNAAYTCFNEALSGHEEIYWSTFCSVFGAQRLAQRLLFDGNATQPERLGLILCSQVADAGGNPPWQAYLEVDQGGSSAADDEQVTEQAASIARFHGRIQLQGVGHETTRLIDFFNQQRTHVGIQYVRAIAQRLVHCGHAEALDLILANVHTSEADDVWESIALERAKTWFDKGESAKCVELATQILSSAITLTIIAEALNYGGDRSALLKLPTLISSNTGLEEDFVKEQAVADWVHTVRILAYCDAAKVKEEFDDLNGKGWYRCWLRFQILLAQADAVSDGGDTWGSVISAYEELARDVSAFVGRPRASDLHRITNLIHESLERSFRHLQSDEQWRDCLVQLQKVVDGISTSIWRSPAGPIAPSKLLDILLPYAKYPSVSKFAKGFILGNESDGTYFSEHAQQGIRLARILAEGDFADEARKEWSRSAVLLTGYGSHKDDTLSELVGSLHCFSAGPVRESLRAAKVTQPLCEAMRLHTDGRGTRHFRGDWFKALAGLAPIHALEILGRSQAVRDGPTSGLMNDATLDALFHVRDVANPLLVHALECTVPFRATYAEEAAKNAGDRLRTIEQLLDGNSHAANEAVRTLVAQIEAESSTYASSGLYPVEEFANRHRIEVPKTRFHPTAPVPPKRYEERSNLKDREFWSPSFLPENGPLTILPGELLRGIRRLADETGAFSGTRRDQSVAAIGYRVIEVAQGGNEEVAGQLLRLLGRSLHWYHGDTHPLVDLGDGLIRSSLPQLATLAYSLAYYYTQGGNSWLAMGDATHDWILSRALETDKTLCQKILASQIAYSLRTLGTPRGITRHLIERIASWGDVELAMKCWWSAYGVIERRIPSSTGDFHWAFEPLDDSIVIEWDIDESLVYVLLCRVNCPDHECKASALAGFNRAVRACPNAITKPLRRFLSVDTPLSSLLPVLHVILHTEVEPYPVSSAIADILSGYARSESYGACELAVALLSRIGRSIHNAQHEYSLSSTAKPNVIRPIVDAYFEKLLSELDELHPGIEKSIRDRQSALLNANSIQKSRRENRLQWMWGDRGDQLPPDPVLLWDTELLLTAMHEALQGLNQALWRQGRWNPEVHSRVLQQVLPFTALHLAVARSRYPRPLYPFPETLVGGRSEPFVIPDPPFRNWVRCGYFERQWVRRKGSLLEPPELSVLIQSGLIWEAVNRSPLVDDYPFAHGLVEEWWNIPEIPILAQPTPFRPVLGATRCTDWLGDKIVLSPPILLGSLLDINAPGFGDPLQWVDLKGEAKVALRAWRTETMSEHYFGPLEFQGCDVVVHPEVFSTLKELSPLPLRELTVISREDLSGSPAHRRGR